MTLTFDRTHIFLLGILIGYFLSPRSKRVRSDIAARLGWDVPA